ncbi:Twinkle protein, mitochondrial [Halotydeus destructor]|nr:Twinkle protein, mitochondrial [Halotydeus destructor]
MPRITLPCFRKLLTTSPSLNAASAGEKKLLKRWTPLDTDSKTINLMKPDVTYKEKHVVAPQPSAIVNFHNLKDKIYHDLVNKDLVCGVPWSRFPQLNRLLKGHRRGEFTVLTGLTGSGKTTFLSEYSLDLCSQGVKTLWGSFEIRNFRLCKMMLSQFSGTKFEDDDIHMFEACAREFQKVPMYFMDFHGQQSLDDVLETMANAVAEHDVHHVIIDNVQFMIGNDYRYGKMNRYEYQDLCIGSFRKFASETDCHITLVIHPRKEQEEELTNNSIFGGGKAIQEADNILILQTKTLKSFKTQKYLQVTKNRFDGELGLFPLTFDKETLSFGYQPFSDSVSMNSSMNR